MDTAALAGVISSLLYEKKNAKNLNLQRGLKNLSEYLTVTQSEL